MCHIKHSWRHCESWREPFHYPQESHHIIVFFFVLPDMSGGISKEGILAVPIDSMMLDRRVADGQLRSVSKLFTSEKMKGSSLERPTISTLQMCVAGRFRPSTFCKVSLHTHTHSLKPDLVSYKKHNETRRNPWLPPIQVTHPRPESPWYDHWVAESIFFLAGKEVFFRIFRLSCLENLGQTNLEARHRLRPEWRERWMARERLAWNSAAPLPEAWDFTTMAFRLKSFSAFERKQEETREIPASLT